MGSYSSACEEAVDALPPAYWSNDLWTVSCRPISMKRFAPLTLLFQPDCRVFCLNGPGCRFRSAEHDEHFLHETSDVVRCAATRDLQSHGPVPVANALLEARTSLPYVRECWSVPTEVGGSGFPPALAGRTVVVWAHGFRQRFYPVLNTGSHLLHRLRQSVGDSVACPAVMTFMWPAFSSRLAYSSARGHTPEAGARLHATLRLLKHHGCRSIIIGHSLGCRVALHALLRVSAAEPGELLCEQLVLIAAAVASDCLAPGGEFPRSRLAAGKIVVVSSQRDATLRDHFPRGEMVAAWQRPVALGYGGPEQPLPADVEHIDASSSIGNHSPNVVLLSWDVQRLLREVVGLPPALPPADDDLASQDSWSMLDEEEESVSLEDNEESDPP